MNPFTSWLRRLCWWFALAPLLLGTAGFAMAQDVVSVPGVPSNVTSGVDRMISYRFQEHMWQTADGATHLMVNRGPLSSRGALTLFTSFDNGATWSAKAVIPQTDYTSTADGLMDGNDLRLVYSDAAGTIMSALLRYDPVTVKWSQVKIKSPVVFSDPAVLALSPGIGVDARGTLWCAFAVQDRTTLVSELRLSARTTRAARWVDTGQRIGQQGAGDRIQRSAKPIRRPGGMGLLASVEEKLIWATRPDSAPVSAAWTTSTFFVSEPPYDSDPFGGHFSLIDDTRHNLHLITPDKGRPLYFRFDHETQTWAEPLVAGGALGSGYVQATRAGERIVLVANHLYEQAVYRSDDYGLSFTLTHRLVHPTTGVPPVIDSPPRMETPAVSRGPVPLVQQYQDGAVQKLLWFEIPVE